MRFLDYKTKFDDLKKMTDTEASHMEADDLLKELCHDLQDKNITIKDCIEVHQMFNDLTKWYS